MTVNLLLDNAMATGEQLDSDNIPLAIHNLIKRITDIDQVEKVILFGSRAYGDHEQRSDVDLAVSAPKISLRKWLDIKFLAEETRTLLFITLVRLEDCPESLRLRIEKEGVILYEQKEN